MTIHEHGLMIKAYYKDLLSDERQFTWKLPAWFTENEGLLRGLQLPQDTLETYQEFHDCGKPLCLTIDEEGRRRFPGHALRSAELWLEHGGDPLIGQLILHDMDFHIMKPADIEVYEHMKLAPSLLLTALCELHANASMFGGIESTSFKIKYKALEKNAKALLQRIKGC